ncbi:glycerol-3-phosphate dehydrogenase/oxidase [Solicola gregarius]|uniref:Glycerol-3-phosphate dehydrogenase n=1 Tax=Solicola gregarius TaxID=2908642 RepID=A0AA46TKR3_9ACTN|nr:glycerol-3-phosphate dehydrogenase/oxidase [Solicola gregarius]UYM07119.1 glycerol-3-phosphate dehydrogenase/oxidase [Solicola gregarius]
MTGSSALNATRRRRELAEVGAGEPIDVLVIGGGITGAGVALDAASRGLRTVLVERRDLAFGTSRWSSKLVHGGLRYLASGDVGIAYESAVERRVLMTHTAPHLVRPMPQLIPMTPDLSGRQRAFIRAGQYAGDALRCASGTSGHVLPRSRRIGRSETLRLAPSVRAEGLDGGLLGWDGQLIDDARLVVAVARTAASYGARILTRVSASAVTERSATLCDELSGESFDVRARAIVNATGVWAGGLDPSVTLRPSRGTHLVFDASTFRGLNAILTVRVPGERNRFLMALPADHGRVYVGLTDEPAPGPVPDVPEPSDHEVDELLTTVGRVLQEPVTRADVRGAFAGLRPLLDSAGGSTSDLSRRHVVQAADGGPTTVVGGKLTTYRRMAQDAVDRAIGRARLAALPSRTARLRLVGAGGTRAAADLPPTLVARYGSEASTVAEQPGGLAPVADGLDVCAAEFAFATSHEGALSIDDILDRRTRIGLVADDRARAYDAAADVVELAQA